MRCSFTSAISAADFRGNEWRGSPYMQRGRSGAMRSRHQEIKATRCRRPRPTRSSTYSEREREREREREGGRGARHHARFYFSHPPTQMKIHYTREKRDIYMLARTCAPDDKGQSEGPEVLEFMRARINCPDRAQDIRTGPTLVPLSLGLTHLTWSEAWRMHALFILNGAF